MVENRSENENLRLFVGVWDAVLGFWCDVGRYSNT